MSSLYKVDGIRGGSLKRSFLLLLKPSSLKLYSYIVQPNTKYFISVFLLKEIKLTILQPNNIKGFNQIIN